MSDAVLVVYAQLNQQLPAGRFAELLNTLPAKRQEKLKRFRKWQDAQRGLLASLLILKAMELAGVEGVRLDDLKFSTYDRPYLEGDIDFNVSHSGNFVVCAITRNCRVGIDVEEIKEVPVLEFEREFSPKELDEMIKSPDRLWAFYSYWTKKEAFLKAIGTGLNTPLNEVRIQDNVIDWQQQQWFLKPVELDENHVCHVCCDVNFTTVNLTRFTV